MRSDLDAILIFLGGEDPNTEARQLDNGDDEEGSAAGPVSGPAARSR
jgi:hypothetical protein